MSPELPEPVISRWRWRTFDNSSWTYSPVPAWADERIEVEHFHPANHLRAALATQAEAHAGELSRMQAEFDTACIALQGETAVERHKVEALRAELVEAREQLSAHDAIRAGLEAERDALLALLVRALPMLEEHYEYALNAPVWHCTGYESNTLQALLPEVRAAIDAARTGASNG